MSARKEIAKGLPTWARVIALALAPLALALGVKAQSGAQAPAPSLPVTQPAAQGAQLPSPASAPAAAFPRGESPAPEAPPTGSETKASSPAAPTRQFVGGNARAGVSGKMAQADLPAEDADLPADVDAAPSGASDTSSRPANAPKAVPGSGSGSGNGSGNTNGNGSGNTNGNGSGNANGNGSGNANGNAKSTAVVKVPGGSGARGSAAVPAGQELVNIDFPEPTEIKDIIKAVALWTGKNVILDRNVNGKVQIISPRKVTKEEAYQAFLSALNILGLTTVETGKVIKIMPVRTAVKGNLKTFLGSSWTMMTDEIITQIVPLKYIDAKEIQSTLSRIVSSNSMIAYQPTNTLIISDSGYKVRRVLDILELLDVQGQQAQVAIVPIKYAEAKNITEKVSEIFKNSAEAKKGSGSSGYRSYKIMTDERTNSVIIFGPPRTIADVKALVRKFDIMLDDPSRQSSIHVRPLDYADAKKLAATLQALATGKKTDAGARHVPIIPPGLPPGTPIPNDQLTVASLSDDLKIAPDEASNSLLITGSHAAYQTLNALIRKLDLRRSQVYVESDILDILVNNGFKFETSVFAGRGGPQDTNIATTWQAAPLAPLIAAEALSNSGQTNNSTQSLQQVASTFGTDDMTVGILSGKQVNITGLGKFSPGALIKMLKTDTNTRILSSPNILTSNNEEASIVVGQKLFFTSRELAPATGAIANKVEKEDVDLTLTIKPNISQSNYVTLNVNLEQNTVAGTTAENLPIVAKRKSKQIVTVKNTQTVVISGLVQTREEQRYSKIPLLGDIPIIGWLFRNTNTSQVKSNLMIFLTPHIIHGADDLAAVYQQKRRETDEFLASIFGATHYKDEFYALLPTKEDGQYVPDDVDRIEKQRRDEMLKEMYESSGEAPPPDLSKPAADEEIDKETGKPTKKAKVDDSPTYVPMSGGEGGGDDGPVGGDGGGAPPPPPPPPPAGGEGGPGGEGGGGGGE